jgi:hypothetical protein
LPLVSDYRTLRRMEAYASRLIDALGGTSAVARMTDTPVSTVCSWRRIGIPKSRMAHLRLAAAEAKVTVDWDNPPLSKRELQAAA